MGCTVIAFRVHVLRPRRKGMFVLIYRLFVLLVLSSCYEVKPI